MKPDLISLQTAAAAAFSAAQWEFLQEVPRQGVGSGRAISSGTFTDSPCSEDQLPLQIVDADVRLARGRLLWNPDPAGRKEPFCGNHVVSGGCWYPDQSPEIQQSHIKEHAERAPASLALSHSDNSHDLHILAVFFQACSYICSELVIIISSIIWRAAGGGLTSSKYSPQEPNKRWTLALGKSVFILALVMFLLNSEWWWWWLWDSRRLSQMVVKRKSLRLRVGAAIFGHRVLLRLSSRTNRSAPEPSPSRPWLSASAWLQLPWLWLPSVFSNLDPAWSVSQSERLTFPSNGAQNQSLAAACVRLQLLLSLSHLMLVSCEMNYQATKRTYDKKWWWKFWNMELYGSQSLLLQG